MHSRERDSPNSRWTYALHAHCDRMPSKLGVCDRPKPPLSSPRLHSRAQATTPENLNQTSDEDLFSRVEAVLSTVNATDAARRAVLAPFVSNALPHVSTCSRARAQSDRYNGPESHAARACLHTCTPAAGRAATPRAARSHMYPTCCATPSVIACEYSAAAPVRHTICVCGGCRLFLPLFPLAGALFDMSLPFDRRPSDGMKSRSLYLRNLYMYGTVRACRAAACRPAPCSTLITHARGFNAPHIAHARNPIWGASL